MRKIIVSSVLIAGLVGCTNPPPISGSPITNGINAINALGGTQASDLMTTGLLNAQYNLNEAVTVGALSATDPAPGCLNQAVAVMGLGATAGASFVPKVTDAISLASVGYIYLAQVKQLTGGSITVPTNCLAVIGQMVLDLQSGLNKGIISAGVAAGGVAIGIPPLPLGLRRDPVNENPSLNGR